MSGRELEVLRALSLIWRYGVTRTKSDISRVFATEIAEAASRGWLTTEMPFDPHRYGANWRLTSAGIDYLLNQARRLPRG